MKNKHGISLITLVVTIMVMIILIGVVGKYSLENIREATNSVMQREFANIREFTLNVQNHILLGEFEVNLEKCPDIELAPEMLYIILNGKLTISEIDKIERVISSDIDKNYKYYYFEAGVNDYFETGMFSEDNIKIQDVKYDYIINFYTGTIIAIYDDAARVEGLIKEVDEIVPEAI